MCISFQRLNWIGLADYSAEFETGSQGMKFAAASKKLELAYEN
jgi:hypothetical protein